MHINTITHVCALHADMGTTCCVLACVRVCVLVCVILRQTVFESINPIFLAAALCVRVGFAYVVRVHALLCPDRVVRKHFKARTTTTHTPERTLCWTRIIHLCTPPENENTIKSLSHFWFRFLGGFSTAHSRRPPSPFMPKFYDPQHMLLRWFAAAAAGFSVCSIRSATRRARNS